MSDNTKGSAPYQEESGGTSERDHILRVTPATANRQQDEYGAGHQQQHYFSGREVYPTEFASLASPEDISQTPGAPRCGEGSGEEDKLKNVVVTADPSNGHEIMCGSANPPPPNFPVPVFSDEGTAKLVLSDSTEWRGETRKGVFVIGFGNGTMRYPPRERHIFTFKEMCDSNGKENSMVHDTG